MTDKVKFTATEPLSEVQIQIGLAIAQCQAAYEIMEEAVGINSLRPGDRSTMKSLNSGKVLLRVQKMVNELEQLTKEIHYEQS